MTVPLSRCDHDAVSSPIVLISAAMAVPSAYYRPVVEAFGHHGWDARAIRSRGFGRDEAPASRSNDWSYQDAIWDIEDAVGKARAEDPDRPVVLLGHSIGAQLAAGHELNHAPCDGFVAIGAAVPWFRHYGARGVPLAMMALGVPVVTAMRGYVPPPLFGAPGARTLMTEWARFMRTGRAPFPAAGRHSTPSLVIHLEGDSFAPERPNLAYIDRFLDPAKTTRWVYRKDAAPAGGGNGHVTWARTPEPVVNRVIDWWQQERPEHVGDPGSGIDLN